MTTDPTMIAIAGDYMNRSIADFQRACSVHIAEEQAKIAPDNALIALLSDAVRCSRELVAALLGDEASSLAKRIADDLFVNGMGQEAERLVLTVDGPPTRDLGGWCKAAVVDRISGILMERSRS